MERLGRPEGPAQPGARLPQGRPARRRRAGAAAAPRAAGAAPWTVAWLNGLVNKENGHLDEAIANFDGGARRHLAGAACPRLRLQPRLRGAERARPDAVRAGQAGTRRGPGRGARRAAAARPSTAFDRTLAIDSENVTAHYALGLIHGELGDRRARGRSTARPTCATPPTSSRAAASSPSTGWPIPPANHAAQSLVIYDLQRRPGAAPPRPPPVIRRRGTRRVRHHPFRPASLAAVAAVVFVGLLAWRSWTGRAGRLVGTGRHRAHRRSPLRRRRSSTSRPTAGLARVRPRERRRRARSCCPRPPAAAAAFVDVDNDGDLDIWCSSTAARGRGRRAATRPGCRRCRSISTTGTATSSIAPAVAGLEARRPTAWASPPATYDNDGWVDLYVTAVGRNTLLRERRRPLPRRHRGRPAWPARPTSGARAPPGSTPTTTAISICSSAATCSWSRDIDLKQDFSLAGIGRAYGPPRNFAGAAPAFYVNDGDRTLRRTRRRRGAGRDRSGHESSRPPSRSAWRSPSSTTTAASTSWSPTTRCATSRSATAATAPSRKSARRSAWPTTATATRARAWASTSPRSATTARR